MPTLRQVLPAALADAVQEQLKRKQVKRLLEDLTALSPRARESMLAAITHVRPSQLADASLWTALGLPVAKTLTAVATLQSQSQPVTSASRRRLPLLEDSQDGLP